MHFGLLGPLEVGDGAALVVAPRRPKERVLLVFLLLQPNRRVPTDELIECVWPGADPSAARRSLQVHASRLRAVVEHDGFPRLEGDAAGYRLRVDAGERDVDRFELLVAEGRSAIEAGDAVEAAVLLRDALALWRGPPLPDVAYEQFAQAELERLHELRREAVEARVDADLLLGRHRQVVPELRAMVQRAPGSEALCERLMLALYRCGRQDEALEAYRGLHTYLARELGLEPGERLRALERGILNHAPHVTAARQLRAATPRSRSPARAEADHVGELAAAAGPHLRTPCQIEWMRRLDAESASVLAACRWALVAQRPEFVLQVGADLWPYWESRAEIGDARAVLDAALRCTSPNDPARARALVAVGRLALRQGDSARAGGSFAAAAGLLRHTADTAGLALAVSGYGWVALGAGHVHAAAGLSRRAVALASTLDDRWIRGDALNTLGTALRLGGDVAGASSAYEEAVGERRRAGDIEGVAATVGSLAWLEVAEGRLPVAETLFREALSESEQRSDVWYASAVELALAYVGLASGDLDGARLLAARGVRSCRRIGAPGLAAAGLRLLAAVNARSGAPGGAAIFAGAAAVGDSSAVHGVRATRHYGWEAGALDAALEHAREDLGAVEWSRLLARGAALAPDEVDELVPV